MNTASPIEEAGSRIELRTPEECFISNPSDAFWEKNHGQFELINFLPYDPTIKKNGELRSALNEYQLLLKMLQNAVVDFERGDFEKFDSLVGENACQIRAIVIAIFGAKKTEIFSEIKPKISMLFEKMNAFHDSKKIETFMHSSINLKQFIDAFALNISLNIQQSFLLQSYILSITKTVSKEPTLYRIEVASPKNLKKFGDISSSFATRLVSKSRKLLSILSVRLLREFALQTNDFSLIEMVSNKYTIKHNSWLCIPMFWAYKIILEKIKNEKIPLIIHAKFITPKFLDKFECSSEMFLLFEPNESINNELFTWKNLSLFSGSNKPVFVVEGVVCQSSMTNHISTEQWREKFNTSTSISEIILAGAADHRQYPDPAFDRLIDERNDNEFKFYKNLANNNGYSHDNPSNFFINHVYASNLNKFTIKP
jgi:hypothetical protein